MAWSTQKGTWPSQSYARVSLPLCVSVVPWGLQQKCQHWGKHPRAALGSQSPLEKLRPAQGLRVLGCDLIMWELHEAFPTGLDWGNEQNEYWNDLIFSLGLLCT